MPKARAMRAFDILGRVKVVTSRRNLDHERVH